MDAPPAVPTEMSKEPENPKGWLVENGRLVLGQEGSDARRHQRGACELAAEGQRLDSA